MTIDRLRTAIAEGAPSLKPVEVHALASHLESEGLIDHGWVSVRDRMPDADGLYLVVAASASKGKPYRSTAWYDPNRPNYGWQGIPDIWASAISYWMPIPREPK